MAPAPICYTLEDLIICSLRKNEQLNGPALTLEQKLEQIQARFTHFYSVTN